MRHPKVSGMISLQTKTTYRAYAASTWRVYLLALVLVAAPLAGWDLAARQAVGTVMPMPRMQFFDNNGDPLAACQLETYASGTSTPLATYNDPDLAVIHANANPVVCDSAGRATVFLLPVAYKFILKDSSGATIWTADGINATAPFQVDLDLSFVAGETIAANDVIFLADGSGGTTAGRWHLADADTAAASITAPILGIARAATATAATGTVRTGGRVTGLGGLVAGTGYFVSATAGALTSSAPTNARFVGRAESSSVLVLAGAVNHALPILNTLQTVGTLGVGEAANTTAGIIVRNTALTSTTQRGVYANPTFNSSATTEGAALTAQPATAATAFTQTSTIGLHVETGTAGAGSTITNLYGIKVEDQTAGTNDFAIHTGTGDVRIGGRVLSVVLQPGFLAFNSAIDTNVATGSVVDFDTEIYDTASNFAADVFTAPVTGIYHFCVNVQLSDASAYVATMALTTSNRTYNLGRVSAAAGEGWAVHGCTYADMDASDTAQVVTLTSVTIDVIDFGGSPYFTWFSGRLVP